jgi:DNA-binding transcriptional regulator YhcF (GntR family)
MPRTKLDALAKKPTAQQRKERIIKKAFAEKGIFTQKEMAYAVGVNEGTLSRAFSQRISQIMVYKLHAFLNFSEAELEELLCTK